VRHSLLIQSLFLKPFVSYLLNIDLFRGLRELLRSDYILIESLAVMLSTGITGGAYKLDPDPLMPYPYLLAWCWSGILTVFFSTGSPLTRAVTPFIRYDGSDTSLLSLRIDSRSTVTGFGS